MHFFFSKLFNTVNDKQTANELYMSTFSSGKCFHQYINSQIDLAIHKVLYISFQISCKAFVGLSASTIHAQRKFFFPLNSSK